MSDRPAAFLFAGSLYHARLTAESDYGWERLDVTPGTYRMADGELAEIAPDLHALRGRPFGSKLYLGIGWSSHHDAFDVEEMLDEGRFIRATHQPQPIRA